MKSKKRLNPTEKRIGGGETVLGELDPTELQINLDRVSHDY